MINGKLTENLLKSISQRLSSREDCKELTYHVIINDSGIHMYPLVYVYPDCHKRKESDKIDVLSFVMSTKFQRIILSGGLDQFVPGEYRYGFIDNSKKRKWRKVNET